MAKASPMSTKLASLYVGDLHPDITDGQLYDFFSCYKSLQSVRICRDFTHRSLCYGYLNLSDDDAILAIKTKNHTLLNGKEIRVMWSRRDHQDGKRSGIIGNVFVKNLDDSIDSSKLQEIFGKFGNISSCKVVTSEDGRSKGYGFVQFIDENSANASIQKLNGTNIQGKQIYVGKFVKRTDRLLPNPELNYTNLYMKNLDQDITEPVLREKFSEFGKILSLAIAKDENGTSKGFGFVNFENPDDAKRAIVAMNGSQFGSKNLYVARAQKKEEREQILRRQFEEKRKEQMMKYMGSNVYIKNMCDEVSDEELRELFSQCGTISSGKLMRDDKGISKGFGFVCFSSPEEASKAVNTFHGYMFYKKPLYVAIAQRKEDRLAQLQHQYAQRMATVLPGPSNTVLPGGYPHIFYMPPGVVAHVPNRQGFMYQPLGVRPGWHGHTAFAPAAWPSPFQPPPVMTLANNGRPKRQSRPRINGQTIPQNGGPNSTIFPKDSTNQQRSAQIMNVSNSRQEVSKNHEGVENLSSMLSAAAPQQQKQILGERLYPLVHNHKPELAAKITGMLLEMDNSELLLLLESPESLTAKVEEALQVLKLPTAKISNQENIHANFITSTEVAVN